MNKFSSKMGSQLIKTASGYKFSISKEEWLSLGKKAGWTKEAFGNVDFIDFDTGEHMIEVKFSYDGFGKDLDIELLEAWIYDESNKKIKADSVLNEIINNKSLRTRLYEKIQDKISSDIETSRENVSFGKNKGKYDF